MGLMYSRCCWCVDVVGLLRCGGWDVAAVMEILMLFSVCSLSATFAQKGAMSLMRQFRCRTEWEMRLMPDGLRGGWAASDPFQ